MERPRRAAAGRAAFAVACAALAALPLIPLLTPSGDALAVPTTPTVEVFPPEVEFGERLFKETRFAQFFATHAVDVNDDLAVGDPALDTSETTGEPLNGPFAGQSMNCRACHLVDEQLKFPVGGMRTYADFARRSPVTARSDGQTRTVRNSPPLVDSFLDRPGGLLLHFDGEFSSTTSLIKGTLTGRNYGWLPGEEAQAIAHIARVIREDDGTGALAVEFGGAYSLVLKGVDPSIPDFVHLSPEFRIDVARASDRQILNAVAKLIAAYVVSLEFERDTRGAFVSSPFDRFLVENDLPLQPGRKETPVEYSARLRAAVLRLQEPFFVDEGPFQFHDQSRIFGPEELKGLLIFLARAPAGRALTQDERARGGIGNCAACHPAHTFTDFALHNTGVTQVEYDEIHGEGAFADLAIPSLAERRRRPTEFLPATAAHPTAAGPFRAIPSAERPGLTDLGVWNVFANPDFPASQPRLEHMLCDLLRAEDRITRSRARTPGVGGCAKEALLDRSVASFKTPNLRDLSHSNPYMHNGAFDTLESVLEFYRVTSERARRGEIRNEAPEVEGIAVVPADLAPLAAFLRSLNEDYH